MKKMFLLRLLLGEFSAEAFSVDGFHFNKIQQQTINIFLSFCNNDFSLLYVWHLGYYRRSVCVHIIHIDSVSHRLCSIFKLSSLLGDGTKRTPKVRATISAWITVRRISGYFPNKE